MVVDNEEEQSSIIFGNGFGPIADLETGPDGFLYVLSYDAGTIYRIVPSSVLSSYFTAGAAETAIPMFPIDEQEHDEQDEEDSASDGDENGDDENN